MATSPYLAAIGDCAPAIRNAPTARSRIACVAWQDMLAEVAPWDRLAANASEPNPFYESWYLLPSLHTVGAKSAVSMLRFEEDGELAGLLPVCHSLHYYHLKIPNLAGWTHPNCFLGTPLIARGSEVAFWTSLLDWADSHAGTALFLHLRSLPIGGPVQSALASVLAETGRTGECVHREARALLCSPHDADTYWEESLSNKKRKELRRQAKRLGEEGELGFVRENGENALGEWIEDFLRLERSGWKGEAGSALACSTDTEALFRESLTGAVARGKLERLSLTLDGKPIAMLATFVSPPGAFSYKTAFDERYARYSPGVLLQQENLALLDCDDVDWCDSCAAADHPMIDRIWRERRELGRYSIAIGGAVRRALFRQIVSREMRGVSQPEAEQ